MELKPGYKQTEVGVIPEDWEVCPMSDVVDTANPIAYGVLKPGHYVQNGIPLLQIRDVIHGDIKTDQLHRISEELDSQYSRTRLLGGEIVVSLVGTIGRVALLPMSLRGGNLHRNLARIYVGDAYDSTFVSHVLKSDYAQAAIKLTTFGSSQALLNLADLRDLSIPVPPLPEQKAIAEALSDMDRLLSGLDSLISKKRDIKQATMQQLLTGKTRLPGFRGEWEVKRLGEVASFLKGKGLPKSDISDSGKHPCIHYGELFTVYGETIGDVRSRTDCIDGMFRSVANDVLMPTSDVTPRGLAKASCIGIDGVILGGDILVIRLASKLVYGSYLSLVIRYEESQVLQLVTGTTVYHLYGSDMKKFTFPLPSLPEQQAIAKVLSDMDAELEALEQRRDKTRELKQAMMQELLTGRTRLV